MKAYLVDVFTKEPGKGNPAAVVVGAGLSEAEMARAASRLGRETAFVDGTVLHYYMPSGEAMELCGHGTLAALAVMGRQGRFTVSTPVGELDVSVQPPMYGMATPPPEFGELVDPAVAAKALGIPVDQIDGPVQPVSAGRPKLMVPVVSTAVLDGMRPDPAKVAEACRVTGTTGIYPFTLQARSFAVHADARQFAAGGGILEDPVTGTAAAALAWYLWRHGAFPGCAAFRIEQGHALGRPGLVAVRQGEGRRAWIYGQAVVTGEAEL